jgi:hypothetical protein
MLAEAHGRRRTPADLVPARILADRRYPLQVDSLEALSMLPDIGVAAALTGTGENALDLLFAIGLNRVARGCPVLKRLASFPRVQFSLPRVRTTTPVVGATGASAVSLVGLRWSLGQLRSANLGDGQQDGRVLECFQAVA